MKLLIAVLTKIAIANLGKDTIYQIPNIDNYIEKCKYMIKNP